MTFNYRHHLQSILLLFLGLNCSHLVHASTESYLIDSLQHQLTEEKNDTLKLNLYTALYLAVKGSNPKRALEIANQELTLAQKLSIQQAIATACSNCCLANYSLGNYDAALQYGLKALKIREVLGERSAIASSLGNIGIVYAIQKQMGLALQYYQKSLALRLALNDKKGLAISYNSLGNAYQDLGNDSLALVNYENSLRLRKSLNDKIGTAQSLNNMAIVYAEQNNLNKSLVYLFQSLAIKQELNDLNGMAASYDNIGDVYAKRGAANKNDMDIDKAIAYYDKSLGIARELRLKEIIKVCCESLAAMHHLKGDNAQAYAYYKEFTLMKDSLLNESIALNETEMHTKYEAEKKEKEIALLNKDAAIAASREKNQRLIIISGILFTIILSGFMLNRYFVKERANNLLTQKNKLIDQNRSELRKQKDIIEQKNRDLTDSIDYAKNVQSLILPSEREIQKLFPDSFVSYLPKSIVSGDFYWLHQDQDQLLIAVIDCTGHGIPGAMMSFLGYNLFENVVKSQKIMSPGLVLKALNNEIFSTVSLKNENQNSKYGMDVSLISIDTKRREILFSGAHHPMYLVRKGELLEYKGDRFSLGTLYTGAEKEFTTHQVFYQKDDILYLFTDGYPDQIGGVERKKYYYGPFKELLIKGAGLSMQQQKAYLESTLHAWKGTRDQTDDVLIMGIRL